MICAALAPARATDRAGSPVPTRLPARVTTPSTVSTTAPVPATELYDAALRAHLAGAPGLLSAYCAAWSCALPLASWCGAADEVDVAALDRLGAALSAGAAVLDLGCGPGRHSAHLAGGGLRVLGVDTSDVAVALTRQRGVPALRADALGRLPSGPGGTGWDAVLLLDGNIGIGGDPGLLLCRVRDLLAPAGRVLVELHTSGGTDRQLVRLRAGRRASAAFPWARLDADDLPGQARCAGLGVVERWCTSSRTFALLGPT